MKWSGFRKIKVGVPQGSVLRPTLEIIMTVENNVIEYRSKVDFVTKMYWKKLRNVLNSTKMATSEFGI